MTEPVPVPTQVRRPWRATLRTAFQAIVAFAVLMPILVETAGLDPEVYPWLALPIAVAAGFARVMALPQVEAFLQRFVPFLAATPKYPILGKAWTSGFSAEAEDARAARRAEDGDPHR